MKLLVVLLFSTIFMVNGQFEDVSSGQDPSGVDTGSNLETTTEDPNLVTASIGSFVIVDESNKSRLCTCAETQRCSFVHANTEVRDECAASCASNLAEIDNNTAPLLDCFNENYLQELEAGEVCIRSQYQKLCSNSYTEKKVSNENWGLTELQFDLPIMNPLYKSTVFMTKAELIYTSIRKYQHCFNSCYRKKERECRDQLKCAADYPTSKELDDAFSNCPNLQQTAFGNARIACKCLIAKKNIVKLVGLCSLFTDTVMNRV